MAPNRALRTKPPALVERLESRYLLSVNFKTGPTFTVTDNGLTLTASGTLSGLGNNAFPYTVSMTTTGITTATCTNKGGNTVEVHNTSFTASGQTTVTSQSATQGNAPFTVTTDKPTNPVPHAPDCPNGNWTETITSIQFTSATITVKDVNGIVVLRQTFTL
jgi:hypothetical protein